VQSKLTMHGATSQIRISLFAIAAVLIVASPQVLPGQTPSPSPHELVREAAQNEVKSNSNGHKFMFRDQKDAGHGTETKLIVETTEASAGMLVALDGKPLSDQQRSAEEARLNGLVGNHESLHKKQKSEKEDAERTKRMLTALPDAFLYERDGIEEGRKGLGAPGDKLVRLKFRPNPQYDPPTRTEQVLAGMQGYVLIDENQHRIAKIDGTLIKDVGFGWGILGRLDKGGHFLVEQAQVGDAGNWEVTRMDLSFTGKIMLIKNLTIKSNEVFTDFREVPSNLTFAQGVELLKKQSSEVAENKQ